MAKNQSSIYLNSETVGNGSTRYVKGTQPSVHCPQSQENVHLTQSYKQFMPQLMGAISIIIDPNSAQAFQPWLYNAIPRFTQVNVIRDDKGNITTDFNIQKVKTITNGVYSVVSRSKDVQLPTIMGVPGQWVKQADGRWKYYDQGQAVSNIWVQYKDDYYLIEADQYMVTVWKILDGNTYYFKTEAEDTNKDGNYGYRISDKWWKIDKEWYYFDTNGAMVTSKVITWKEKKYYVGGDGVMVENKTIVDTESNQTYTANKEGVLRIDKPLEGSYVDIPQDRDLGTVISYMGWHKITSKSSAQYKLKQDATDTGRASIASPEYYVMIDDRILIATKENIGGIFKVAVGDYVDVDFKKKDGTITTYDCIIGDIKGADASSNWGHYDGKGVVEIIYYNYNPPAGYNKCINNPWGQGRVIRITKTGNYYGTN